MNSKTEKNSKITKSSESKISQKKENSNNVNPEIKEAVESKLKRYYGISNPSEATEEQIYRAVVLSVKDILLRKRAEQHNAIK